MKNDFNVCPMCAGKKIKNLDNRKWICEDCGFDLYCNVAAAVGVIIYDDENNEIMYIDHSTDECIWYFHSDNIINVTADMELYNLLYIFMNNYYDFGDEILQNYKDSNKLIWYSDCYYNPDDKWSIASVSCLNIERNDNNEQNEPNNL